MTFLDTPRLPDRSPTPRTVYEPNFWKGRVWVKGGPMAGIGFRFKSPYGVAMNAASVLMRACTRGQILRFQLGPMPVSEIRRLDRVDRERGIQSRNGWRTSLERFEPIFERIGVQHGIDWGA